MNLKKTTIGLGAAAALSLSMISGAMAQGADAQNGNWHDGDEESQTVTASVNLVDGVCAFTLGASNLDFGELTWTGYEWDAPADQTLTLAVTDGHDGDGCHVNASSYGLFPDGAMDGNGDMAAEAFNWNGDNGDQGDNGRWGDRIGVMIDGNELNRWPTSVYDGGSTDGVDLTVGLNTSNPDLDAGHYAGDIDFQLGRGR